MIQVCGIYRIVNKLNGKSYIGQSKDIFRRYNDHYYNNGILYIDRIMQELGKDNFELEILHFCDPTDQQELDRLEEIYISIYNTSDPDYGYNISNGGTHGKRLTINYRGSILSDDEVYDIREAYNNHARKLDIYDKYKDKISINGFDQIWQGKRRQTIHMDVYTPENLNYYANKTSLGGNGKFASFTDEEVMELRRRYMNETAKEIYESVKDRCEYQTLQQILWGRHYSHLPIYDKRKKIWINN